MKVVAHEWEISECQAGLPQLIAFCAVRQVLRRSNLKEEKGWSLPGLTFGDGDAVPEAWHTAQYFKNLNSNGLVRRCIESILDFENANNRLLMLLSGRE